MQHSIQKKIYQTPLQLKNCLFFPIIKERIFILTATRNKAMKLYTFTKKSLFLFFAACIASTTANVAMGQSYIPAQKQKVFINGVEVISSQTLRRNTIKAELPDELQSTRTRMAIENRQRIQIYDHSPTIGPKNAPINIVEFNDLSCKKCREASQKIDSVRNKHPKRVRHIYVHTPVDAYNATNPAAFYGRIAQDNDLFWKYRASLYRDNPTSENVYIDRLVDIGMTMDTVREKIRDNARRYYREIDADAMLASKLGEKSAPVIFINGIRIGNTITLDNVDLLIDYELNQSNKNN